MLISVSGDGKKLIESGTFNHVLGDAGMSEIMFNVSGLSVKLITKTLPEHSHTHQTITARVEDGIVILEHAQKVQLIAAPSGMLVPMEIGSRNNRKVYVSWLSFILKTNEGVNAASTTYSFYEDI